MLKQILFYVDKWNLEQKNDVATILEIMILFEDSIKYLVNNFLLILVKKKIGLPNIDSAVALSTLINKFTWESLGSNVLKCENYIFMCPYAR